MSPNEDAHEASQRKAALAALVAKAGGYIELTAAELHAGAASDIAITFNPVTGATALRTPPMAR